MKAAKLILISLFLFFLVYQTKNKLPTATELKTLDFITSAGVDISSKKGDEKCSITYITNAEILSEDAEKEKKIFNIKSGTFSSVIEKIQNLTNKSMTSSHLKYILLGKETFEKGLDYFIKNYANNPKMRLDTNVFMTETDTSEEFLNKMLASKIDVNKRLDGMTDNSGNICSLTKKDLKDLFQLYFSDEKSGVIPILNIEESPEKEPELKEEKQQGGEDIKLNTDTEKKEPDENKDGKAEEQKKDEKIYTFDMNSLAIIKEGKIAGKIEKDLIQAYLILHNKIKNFNIRIDENDEVYNFMINKSQTEIKLVFENKKLKKAVFNIEIETDFDESDADVDLKNTDNLNHLNELQTKQIKSEIDKLIKLSIETNTDILGIIETLSVKHPIYFEDNLKNREDKTSLLSEIDYEINIKTETKRFYNFYSSIE